ncbi:probable salivary secreted peptide [Belonocnema kinseyi]|uniref:probable salivary secreted peptide n=1 Tax=Belonocnema kinseyi TaxID=2817044 RepID=UPI00143CCB8D|nr:probable salivary secreted peptide [Belonocnema kinseyi]
MALIKSIEILTILIIIVVAANSALDAGHDLIVGSRLAGDKCIYKENIVKAGKWFQIVEVTKKIKTTRDEKVTQIIAKDHALDGTGAFAKVIEGGPMYYNVTMNFKSQRSYGIDFTLEVYAR